MYLNYLITGFSTPWTSLSRIIIKVSSLSYPTFDIYVCCDERLGNSRRFFSILLAPSWSFLFFIYFFLCADSIDQRSCGNWIIGSPFGASMKSCSM